VRSLILLAILFASPAAAVPVAQGRDGERFTIAVDVELVEFNVTVTDRNGRPVSGLEADAFEVYEEDRPEVITLFRSGNVPASIGIVIDSSGSMGRKHADVVRAALAFAGASNPEDELFVLSFNEKAYFGLPPSIPFTNDLDRLRAALLRSAPSGMTALYDALAMGLDHLKRGSWDRTALVVLSDGGDNASRIALDEVLQRVRVSNASIYTIGIYDDGSSDRNPGVLRRIAQLGAGRVYFPTSTDDLLRVWNDISEEIRSQYTIGYTPTNPTHDGQFRRIRIAARAEGGRALQVRARDGYFAPPQESHE